MARELTPILINPLTFVRPVLVCQDRVLFWIQRCLHFGLVSVWEEVVVGWVYDGGSAQHLFEFERSWEEAFARFKLIRGATFPLSRLLFEAHEELLGVTSYLWARPRPDVALYSPPIFVEELQALQEQLVLFLCPATVLSRLFAAASVAFLRHWRPGLVESAISGSLWSDNRRKSALNRKDIFVALTLLSLKWERLLLLWCLGLGFTAQELIPTHSIFANQFVEWAHLLLLEL